MRGPECDPVAIFLRSVPQIPQVWTRTRISPTPISGTGTSSRRTSFTPRYTAAFIVDGTSGLTLSRIPPIANVDDRAIAIADFVANPIAAVWYQYVPQTRRTYVRWRTLAPLSLDSARLPKTRPAPLRDGATADRGNW